ncbi:hypothetical protein GE061_003130 [Apolygus lucorum]|uniref:CCHC-type domain-containing protein n=1 Tax=Apolygus lucorum TaxID=248454 RepID=A0A8S9X2Y1_APOLU|nr:hypothetical protein GE061_003130 [Apolygus lucorum]
MSEENSMEGVCQAGGSEEVPLLQTIRNLLEKMEERHTTRVDAQISAMEKRILRAASQRPCTSRQTPFGDTRKNVGQVRTRASSEPSKEIQRSRDRLGIRGRNHEDNRSPQPRGKTVDLREKIPKSRRSSSSESDRYEKFQNENSVKSVIRQVTFGSRCSDKLRFRTVDPKLEGASGYKIWHRKIVNSIDEQDCAFVLDTDLPRPECFESNEVELVTKKVKYFIEASMDDYHIQTVIGGESEKAVEFIARFNDVLRDVTRVNPQLATEDYVRTNFLISIRDTTTYDRVRLMTADSSKPLMLRAVKDMLIDDEVQETQRDLMTDKGAAMTAQLMRGRGKPGRGRKRGILKSNNAGPDTVKRSNMSSSSVEKKPTPHFERKPVAKGKCTLCKKEGHFARTCFKRRKTCYNCDRKGHIAAECPEPRSERFERARAQTPNEMRRAQSWDMRQNKQPQVLKMKLGYAKMLACRFETSTDAAFKIFGNRNGSDNSDVWVAIGENEKRAPDVAKYLHENKDMALHNSEERLKRRHGNLDSPVDKKRTRNMGFSTAECCEGEIVVTAGGSKDPHPLEFVGGRESEREDALVKIQGMDSLENRTNVTNVFRNYLVRKKKQTNTRVLRELRLGVFV